MTEQVATIALLFDDGELVGQLREALHERGAQIVHEGSLAQLSRSVLDACGAQVLVINLDGDAEETLERLHDMIDDGRPRVVFNDAQASRGLNGWDRARWARHLAVKVLAHGDIDPPRPEQAPTLATKAQVPNAIELASVDPGTVSHDDVAATALHASDAATATPLLPSLDQPADPVATADSETLAAELEALLAADQQGFEGEDLLGDGLDYQAGADLLPLHDGDFSTVAGGRSVSSATGETVPAPAMAPAAPPAFQLDHLSLLPLNETFAPPVPSQTVAADAVGVAMAASASWSLVDDDEWLVTETAADMPAIELEKRSTADDFVSPVESDRESSLDAGLGLELLAQHEAIAPQSDPSGHEMQLDELGGVLSRVVALGAAVDSEAAVAAFLAALPGSFRLPVVLIQHLGDTPVEQLAQRLATRSALPVKIAVPGMHARGGEVLLVPPGPLLRLLRDGLLERQGGSDSAQPPSIDAVFTAIAHNFGRDVRAIVFAGRANDAVAGAQAVHDRGGQVWTELSPGEHFADMVHGVQAERLVSFSGTPQALAARLTEEFS